MRLSLYYPASELRKMAREASMVHEPISLYLLIAKFFQKGRLKKETPQLFVELPSVAPGMEFTPKHESKHLDYFALSKGIVGKRTNEVHRKALIIQRLIDNQIHLWMRSSDFNYATLHYNIPRKLLSTGPYSDEALELVNSVYKNPYFHRPLIIEHDSYNELFYPTVIMNV